MTKYHRTCSILGLLLLWPLYAQGQTPEAPSAFSYNTLTMELYASIKVDNFTDMQPRHRSRRKNLTAKLRLGMRLDNMLAVNTMVSSDVQVVTHYRDRQPGDKETANYLRVKRLMLRTEELFGSRFSYLELGRKRLKDDYSWLVDDDMDYLLGGIDSTLLDIELGIARWLWDGRLGRDIGGSSDKDQDLDSDTSQYAFARINYQWHHNQFVEIGWFRESYRQPTGYQTTFPNRVEELVRRAELDWLTIKANGTRRQLQTEWEYWGIVSWLYGDEWQQNDAMGVDRRLDMEGQMGWNFGLIGRFAHNRYALGLGVAGAEGERDNGNLQYFRQPVTAQNKQHLISTNRRYIFGETMTPDVSNLQIYSLWGGWAIKPAFWIEAGLHYYRQSIADDTVFFSYSDLKPNGNSKDIGMALDLILGGSLNPNTRMQLILGGFRGGKAFDTIVQKDDAYRILLELNTHW